MPALTCPASLPLPAGAESLCLRSAAFLPGTGLPLSFMAEPHARAACPLLRVTSSRKLHLLCAPGSCTGSSPCSDRKIMPRLPADGGSGPLWGHGQIWTHFLHPPFFLWLALSWVTFSGLLFLTVVPSMLCLPLQVTYLPFPLPSVEVCCCFQLEAL